MLPGIGLGVLLGLATWGIHLAVSAPSKRATWWLDMLAAARLASPSTFFSTPRRVVILPILAGAVSHLARWECLHLGLPAVDACLMAGALLAPMAQRRHLPFAPLGFASVVSMVSGVYAFRAASGIVELARNRATYPAEVAWGIVQDLSVLVTMSAAIVIGLAIPLTISRRFRGDGVQ